MTKLPPLEWHQDFDFPDPEQADESGVVCWGGNLSPGMLVSAYRRGLFPWYAEGRPILWHSPDPRFVLFPQELHVSKTMGKILRQGKFTVTLDQAFSRVIRACGETPRPGQDGTWVTRELIQGYEDLHALGMAHSVEVWQGDNLVGGLFGEGYGEIFFGESMFSLVDNASKAGFLTLVPWLVNRGVKLIDCQVETQYLGSLGARNIPRGEFLDLLSQYFAVAPQPKWSLGA